MTPDYERGGVRLYCGDCLDVLAELGVVASAVVCDPPYGLKFMGKAWDHGVPGVAFWQAIMASALPGAHLMAFGGTRTWHRLACGIEDAGWELRDTLMWITGQGFPKSHDVGKAIDKAAGAVREVVGNNPKVARRDGRQGPSLGRQQGQTGNITGPATDAARQWDGWGTGLKPAWEPVVLARKRFVGTVASNVVRCGCGAINVDGCRVGVGQQWWERGDCPDDEVSRLMRGTKGRWPANLVLSHLPECRRVGEKRVKGVQVAAGAPGFGADRDDGYEAGTGREYAPDGTVEAWECVEGCPVRMLDEQSGERASSGRCNPSFADASDASTLQMTGWRGERGYTDTGGASRFFYCAKASRRERGVGNDHPTVKPLALMRWLVRLVTPPGGTVLDPFCGSGSTLVAAIEEGFPAVGIDSDPHAIEIAAKRSDAALDGAAKELPFTISP